MKNNELPFTPGSPLTGTESQLNQIRDFAKRRGWAIYNEYIDHGYTGANTERPAFTEMIADARKKNFGILLV